MVKTDDGFCCAFNTISVLARMPRRLGKTMTKQNMEMTMMIMTKTMMMRTIIMIMTPQQLNHLKKLSPTQVH